MADKPGAKVSGSRQTVICDFCGKNIEQRHLKDHTDGVHKRAEKNLKEFMSDLLDEMYHVYREEDLMMVEQTRPLTDWASLAIRIKERSVPNIHALERNKFSKCAQKVCRSVRDVDSEELQTQFYKLIKRLHMVTKDKSYKELEKTDSKELIKQFSKSKELYEGIELVLRATYEASVKLSVESIAESVISIYNLHNSKIRKIGEKTANDELFIAVNGPEIGEADNTLEAALNLHFSKNNGQWNFITNTVFKTCGPTVQNKLNEKNKLNIY